MIQYIVSMLLHVITSYHTFLLPGCCSRWIFSLREAQKLAAKWAPSTLLPSPIIDYHIISCYIYIYAYHIYIIDRCYILCEYDILNIDTYLMLYWIAHHICFCIRPGGCLLCRGSRWQCRAVCVWGGTWMGVFQQGFTVQTWQAEFVEWRYSVYKALCLFTTALWLHRAPNPRLEGLAVRDGKILGLETMTWKE